MKTKPRFFYGYIVVLASVCISMVSAGAIWSFGVFFEPLLTEFGWTRAVTSGAFSLFWIETGLVAIAGGWLCDRFGPKLVITVCSLSVGLGYLLMSQISTIWQFYLVYGVMIGMGGGSFVSLLSTVAKWFVKRRGIMTGTVLAGASAGGMIGPPVANWLISTAGWRISYGIIGIVTLLVIIPLAQFLRREPGQLGLSPYGKNEVKAESLNSATRGLTLQQAIHTRQFWQLAVIYFCSLFGPGIIMTHIVIHATGLGILATNAANILAIVAGAGGVARFAMGIISDRVGNKSALIACLILMSSALFWLMAAKEEWMFYLFGAIFGFGWGGSITVMSPLIARLFGLISHGVILGIVIFSSTFAQAISPTLAGGIFDITGSYQIAFLIGASVSATGFILTLFLRPISRKGGTND